ncbi:hypothetical protein [Streptomyces umbrinus]|uniref:hypothetical protein n=1 Tax=Streptomyces umbrinus TaxID=67370 RepID=UPI0033CD937A
MSGAEGAPDPAATLEGAVALLATGARGIFLPVRPVGPVTVKFLAAHTLVRRAARELLGTGTHESPAGVLDHGELNTLLGKGC